MSRNYVTKSCHEIMSRKLYKLIGPNNVSPTFYWSCLITAVLTECIAKHY